MEALGMSLNDYIITQKHNKKVIIIIKNLQIKENNILEELILILHR